MTVRDPKATTLPMDPIHARKQRTCKTITPRKTWSNAPKLCQECILAEMTPITDNSATDLFGVNNPASTLALPRRLIGNTAFVSIMPMTESAEYDSTSDCGLPTILSKAETRVHAGP